MLYEEVLLLLLTSVLIIGVPAYLFFRERMLKKPSETRVHSRKRVIKLTAVNILLNLVAALYFSIFLILILQRTVSLNNPILLGLIVIYLVIIWLTFYGNGIYITSIILEDYTLPGLRVDKTYQTQFIATHLFHGPISHILIYSGWMLVLLTLAVTDIYLKLSVPSTHLPIILIAGCILGFFYAFAQIYNGTAIYQFVTGVISTVIIVTVLFLNQIRLSAVPIATYFLGFITTFDIVLVSYLGYLLFLKTKGRDIVWDKSGNTGESKPGENSITKPFKY